MHSIAGEGSTSRSQCRTLASWEGLGKKLCEISRCRAKSHTTKIAKFCYAEGQREAECLEGMLIAEGGRARSRMEALDLSVRV